MAKPHRPSLSRRGFLQLLGGATGSLAFSSMFEPRLLLAQSQQGTGKNLVVCNLLGGLDGLAAYPFTSGPLVSVVNSELRPSLAISPGSALSIGGQSGLTNRLGLHPAFAPLHALASSRMKVVQGYGIPGDPGRSHDTCQILMSLGKSRMEGTSMVGFLARLMDTQNWESMQYWALRVPNSTDVNSEKNPPVTTWDLDSLDFTRIGWEDDNARDYIADLRKSLIELRSASTPLHEKYSSALRSMHDTVAVVRSDIAEQSVGNNSAGNYSDDWLGYQFRDAAKILASKVNSPNVSFRNKDMLILTAQDGYDTHSDQNNSFAQEAGIGARLGELASNLAVFYRDLQTFGLLDDTVIVLVSEFGRTTYQNAPVSQGTAGTDHGHGSNTLIIGPTTAGVVGDAPTANELRDQWYNATIPKVDFRNVFGDIFSWMGIPPSSIFDETGYTYSSLGLFS
ncbi:MAG: DUF1501 domain-containing protein [Bdellovibrionales bacterium]|nr:DUF1501 domain-containing protein [Bdellovibrionales bacterium]